MVMLSVILSIQIALGLAVEASGGMVLPGSVDGNNPALELELRAGIPVSRSLSIFLSGCFWESENFSPDGNVPGFTGMAPGWGYGYHTDYSDSHRGFQLGCGKNLGFFSIEAAGGHYSRTVVVDSDGPDFNICTWEGDKEGFISSAALSFSAGENGILRLGTRNEDFKDWFFTVSAGVGFNFSMGGED